MRWWKRGIRIVRLGLLVLAGVSLILYAAGIPGVWWYTPWRVMLCVRHGVLTVERYGPGAIVKESNRSTGLGDPSGMSVTFGTSGVTQQTRYRWLWTTTVVRGAGGPASPGGGPPPKPGSYNVAVYVWLGRLAMIAGVLGGLLLLVRTREHPRGSCSACGYDLRGLARGVACPECGVRPHPDQRRIVHFAGPRELREG